MGAPPRRAGRCAYLPAVLKRPSRRLSTPIVLALVVLVSACGRPEDGVVDWRATAARQRRMASTTERPSEEDAQAHAITIHQPASLTSIPSEVRDANDASVGIGCQTCHSLADVIRGPQTDAADAGGPHAGLVFRHGTNLCASCHDPADPTRLHLATGEPVPMTEAMRLCAQCHGPQFRDYTRGSHGGMRGYWDLTRGPRQRNHCIDCHDAHAPAYPHFRPMPRPNDRFPPATPGEEHT